MAFSTSYLGLELRSPLVASSSPLSTTLDGVKSMERAGLGAVVLFSIFEEQLENDHTQLMKKLSQGESYANVISSLGNSERLRLGPPGYLLHLDACKRAVDIPIIASVNAVKSTEWSRYAKLLQDVGADAVELNLYELPTDPNVSAAEIEDRYVKMVDQFATALDIPVSVKLSPYFSSLPHMARRLVDAGAKGLVLFNRFYQPDVDLESDQIEPRVNLSTSEEVLARIQWIGLLSRAVPCDYAATGGVHSGEDVLKLLRVGARVAMLCSTLLSKGLDQVKRIEQDIFTWMVAHDLKNFDELRERPLIHTEGLERVQYLRTLESWDPESLNRG